LIFILGILIGVFFNNSPVTGGVVNAQSNKSNNDYTYTKAVCNSTKCIDVVVNCSNGNITEIRPISEVVEFEENWSDFRNDSRIDCSDNKN
jgi:hypothetical protein